MAEPERRDEPEPPITPEVALEPEILDASPPPAAPETPVPTAVPLLPQNYHVSLWTTPVSYVCLRCPAIGFTHETVCSHVTTAHGEEPLPTPLAVDYLARNPFVMSMVGEESAAEDAVMEDAQHDDDVSPDEEASA